MISNFNLVNHFLQLSLFLFIFFTTFLNSSCAVGPIITKICTQQLDTLLAKKKRL